jgi:hypothetical protein
MDQAILVKSDRDIGAKVIEALGHRRIPVSVWDWTYVPQLEEWQLVIATPWVDQKGLGTSYRALIGALQKANIYSEVPMRRLFLKSPKDPSVKEIEREIKGRKEGFLHIIKHSRHNEKDYSLLFAPTVTQDGAAPIKSFSDLESLKAFLSGELKLGMSRVEDALQEAGRTGASSIYPVMLTTRQIKKLGNGARSSRARKLAVQ